MLIAAGGISLYFGISFTSVLAMAVWSHIFHTGDYGSFGNFVFTFGWMGIPFLVMGVVIFYKSPIIRQLLGYAEKA